MINAILIIIIGYLLWVIFCLGKDRLWYCKKAEGQTASMQPQKRQKKGSIMGETRTVISHPKPTEAKQSHIEKPVNQVTIFAQQTETSHPAKVAEEEFDTVFSNTPMDIEVQAEYPPEEEIEEEDISCMANGEVPPTAQGLDFDEMSNLIKVMKQKEDTPQELEMAIATIGKVRDTELFGKMVSSINGDGLARIEAMFAKNESLKNEPPATDEFEDFDFKSFLLTGNGNK